MVQYNNMDAKKKKILLVEDDLATIDVYEAVLKRAGFDIETIKWGEEALEKVRKMKEGKIERPDLVLLDLILPDINGIEILEEIRKHKETENLPVLILTNYTSSHLEDISSDLKAGYFIKTDYNPSELVEVIRKNLKG